MTYIVVPQTSLLLFALTHRFHFLFLPVASSVAANLSLSCPLYATASSLPPVRNMHAHDNTNLNLLFVPSTCL